MIYGLIIAAGKQSRFNSEVPKALATINDRCLLDINISNMSEICDEVWVIASYANAHYFTSHASRVLAIDSGYGSGDAIMKALVYFNILPDDRIFIQWGDCISHNGIYRKLYDLCDDYTVNRGMIVPCVFEQTPYVQLIPTSTGASVKFSKYGETTKPGYHDISIFYGNAWVLKKYLVEFAEKITDTNTKQYKHKHGNEMEFLDLFNETSIPAELLVLDNYKDLSFNTLEELQNLSLEDI
jgi:hypothetical protein